MDQTIRVGVNGYGVIGKRVADAVTAQQDMELVGVSDVISDYRITAAVSRVRARGLVYSAARPSRCSRRPRRDACCRPASPSETPGILPHNTRPSNSCSAWRTRKIVVATRLSPRRR